MKKILVAFAIAGSLAAMTRAGVVYTTPPLVNGLQPVSANYTLNLNTAGPNESTDRLAMQLVYSSPTLSAQTFTDGGLSTGSFIVESNSGLTPAYATDQITIAQDSVIQSSAAFNSLTVLSTNSLTGATLDIAGYLVINNGWRIDLATDTAADVASQINSTVNLVHASAAGATVNLVATTKGIIGNTYTLASSTPSAISVTTSLFTGGRDPALNNASLTINGFVYQSGLYWNKPTDSPVTSTGTAVSIASVMNTISGISAHATGSVVYATTTAAGASGNAFTVVSSTPAAMTVATPTFTGGASQATVSINGVTVNVSTGSTTSGTATNTAANINANASLSPIVAATATGSTVTVNGLIVGPQGNYALLSSTPSAVTASGANMTGGTNSAYLINTGVITIPANGFANGLGVTYTQGASAITPLVNSTVYYTGAVTPNTFELSTTSTGAVAGVFITLTSSSTTGPHTYTLTPQSVTGTGGLAWYESNDCQNWTAILTTSTTIPSPYAAGTQTWDFGTVNFACIQAQYTAPTTGGLNIKIIPNGKN